MSQQKVQSNFKTNLLFPLIVASICGGVGWFLNDKFGPKNVDKDILKSIQSQTETLHIGFGDVVNIIKSEGQLDSQLVNYINVYNANYSHLANTINTSSKKYNINIAALDTTTIRLTPSFPIMNTEVKKDSIAEPINNERKISITIGDKNAIKINTQNQIAVIEERSDKKSLLIVINHNGVERHLTPGDQIAIRDDDKTWIYLVYDGQNEKEYMFRLVKKE